jgi:hypothetical protein
MYPLLLAGTLAAAKQRVEMYLHRAMLGVAAYSALAIFGIVALGFITAAGLLWLLQTNAAIASCLIIAGSYAGVGILIFLIFLLTQSRRHRKIIAPAIVPIAGTTNTIDINLFPGGIGAVGLLAVAGYLMAKSVTRKW